MKKFLRQRHLIVTAFATLIVLIGAIWAGTRLYRSMLWHALPDMAIVEPPPNIFTTPQNPTATATSTANGPGLFRYIEVVDSCGAYYQGACVNLRSGPGTKYPIVAKLRTGVVLKVKDMEVRNGRTWYEILFDGEIRFPERVTGDWFVAADVVQEFLDDGDHELAKDSLPTAKHIVVDVSEEMLYAYDGETLFMKEPISTGLEFTPTPRGTFNVYKMTPSRYMQGPIPDVSDQYYDLPGVPWNLYFTYGGAVIHGAYWHDRFGEPWSHGCVNLPPEKAKELYLWADIGTKVLVQD